MDEFNKIRKEFHLNGKSLYQIAREYRRSWATVKSIVTIPEHKIALRGSRPKKSAIVITSEVEQRIDQFLEFEITHRVPKKQRFTAAYIFKKLKEESIYKGSSKRLRTVIAQIRKEKKQTKNKSFLSLDFEFGYYLQIDHGPAEVEIDGQRLEGYLFVASVPGACLRFCQFFPTKAQEAWGHFHEVVFNFFGGTFSNVIYDNDSVLKINKTGEETSFCIEMQIHYKFKAIYCNKASGWEKGAVESAVGFCRRNFLAGIQSFNAIENLNEYLEEQCLQHIVDTNHYVTNKPLSELYSDLKNKITPFEKGKPWGRWEDIKVDNFQYISYQYRNYSVPERYIGCSLRVFISVANIDIYDGMEYICTHQRLFLQKNDSPILDHYLDQLLRKPRAVKHAKVMNHHKFASHILELKKRLESRYNEKDSAKNFVQILLLKRTSSNEDFNTAIHLALNYNAISFQGVQSILRQLQTNQTRSTVDVDHPTIDRHFSLNKYLELEQKEIIDD